MDEALVGAATELEPDAAGTAQPGKVFFLEQVLDKGADRVSIIDEAARMYPPDLLADIKNFYVLVDIGQIYSYRGGILAARNRNFLDCTLEEFVDRVEKEGKGVVVSFGQRDFDGFEAVVGQKNLWRVHETTYQEKVYKVHKYGDPAGRR